MGGVAKALITLDGQPLIRRTLDALRAAGVRDTVVVTGAHHARIAPVVPPGAARVVYNPEHARGQQTSVRLGLESVDPQVDALLMVLCDQPLIGAGDLGELLAAFASRPAGEMLVPEVDGQRGNPVVVSGAALRRILGLDRGIACREFMRLHPELVWRYRTSNGHFVLDLDSVADLGALARQTGLAVGLPG